MENIKAFNIRILLLLIILSVAAPTPRSLVKEYQPMISTNEVEMGEGFFEGRMDFEKTDYSEVGANPEHDPKPPAKV